MYFSFRKFWWTFGKLDIYCCTTGKLRLFVWKCLSQYDRTARTRPGKLEIPFIRIQVLTQCIPAVPDPMHCFAPAPWSFQQRGIDPATNVSINHSRTQQGCIVQRHSRGCLNTDDQGLYFRLCIPSLRWGDLSTAKPGAGRLCGLIYEWTDGWLDEGQEAGNKGKREIHNTKFICVSLIPFHLTKGKLWLIMTLVLYSWLWPSAVYW